MSPAPLRLVVLFCGALSAAVLGQARACGYEPEDQKGIGEACTRTDECQAGLECRGGVCMLEAYDAGPGFDAGRPDTGVPSLDAGPVDAALDSGAPDASIDAGP